MNMVVAEFSGIGFAEYASRMAPVAVAGWVVAFVVLRLLFARQLGTTLEPQPIAKVPPSKLQRRLLAVVLVVLGVYPVLALLGAPIWPAATTGAAVALLLAHHHQGMPSRELTASVSWDTLAFLLAVLVISLGLRDVGFVERLARAYHEADVFTVGVMSALGSAVLNNHPMSHLNMIALESASAPRSAIFAALVGGDLGPRLLPMGSLAGLLWLEMLRRAEVNVGVGAFIRVGVLVAIPTMAVSLAILATY
jgi:arsenical pump membrane protein